jgi:predicted ATPase/class 3 adenylate cyclase
VREANLPTGTVTFLFSDIEGSTRLLDRLGDEYREVLESHQRILRGALSPAGGIEVSTEGDSFFVVFPTAPPAVAAAIEAQRALDRHPWPPGAEVRVRIGVHTGEGALGGDNYVGADVHRASRIAAAGHGGQVLVSSSTRALVEGTLPEGVVLRELGEHRLKDLPRPERLYQAVAPDLPSDFPPPRGVETERPSLPRQLTTFVGRERERREVGDALAGTRLLTLTGPGGTGKTRLAIQVASDLMDSFEDGAVFVPLAPITDPSLVVPTIGQTLGVPEDPGRPSIESLIDHLARKRMLLVLDNFEQVIDAAPQIGELLTATEAVTVLATSREPLGLAGEHEYAVPPLSLPDVEHLPPLESLSQFSAVALFIERARAVRPDFQVTAENAPAIAEVTARLDGLPLAIELAAARTKLLSPEAMLKRLEDRLSLGVSTRRDLPQRQQTLRDAIAWSDALLDGDERRLFARASVFVGGFTLEVADEVTNPDGELGIDTLDGLASLVNKSLVRRVDVEGGDLRFLMLETIREYARERLEETGEADEVRSRHAAAFLALVERARLELTGPDQVQWLRRLSAEHDNLRAALAWTEARGDLETAFRLAGSLWRFWQMRGHLREARDRLTALLSRDAGSATPEARALALEAAGGIHYWMAQMTDARRFYEECLDLRREIGDPKGIADALYNLGFALLYEGAGQPTVDRARKVFREAKEEFRRLGDRAGMARALWAIADATYVVREYEEVLPPLREGLEIQRELGNRFDVAWSRFLEGLSLLHLGRTAESREAFGESLRILAEANDISGVPLLLWGFGALATEEGDGPRAVRLAGAAAALEASTGLGLVGVNEEIEEWERRQRDLVPPEDYDRLWREGLDLTTDQAVALALDEGPPTS